jgi:hypothetical protein
VGCWLEISRQVATLEYFPPRFRLNLANGGKHAWNIFHKPDRSAGHKTIEARNRSALTTPVAEYGLLVDQQRRNTTPSNLLGIVPVTLGFAAGILQPCLNQPPDGANRIADASTVPSPYTDRGVPTQKTVLRLFTTLVLVTEQNLQGDDAYPSPRSTVG